MGNNVPSTERRTSPDITVRFADLVQSGYIQVEQRYRRSGAKSSLLFTIPDFEKFRTTKR